MKTLSFDNLGYAKVDFHREIRQGVPVSDIHFHEVGTMDAVADITAVCLLMNELAPDEVICSPVHVGSGHVKCAHGNMTAEEIGFAMDRRIETAETPYGKVHRKISSGYGMSRTKYEYEDLAQIARGQALRIEEVKKLLEDV